MLDDAGLVAWAEEREDEEEGDDGSEENGACDEEEEAEAGALDEDEEREEEETAEELDEDEEAGRGGMYGQLSGDAVSTTMRLRESASCWKTFVPTAALLPKASGKLGRRMCLVMVSVVVLMTAILGPSSTYSFVPSTAILG